LYFSGSMKPTRGFMRPAFPRSHSQPQPPRNQHNPNTATTLATLVVVRMSFSFG
jgi:hypothetical protein